MNISYPTKDGITTREVKDVKNEYTYLNLCRIESALLKDNPSSGCDNVDAIRSTPFCDELSNRLKDIKRLLLAKTLSHQACPALTLMALVTL